MPAHMCAHTHWQTHVCVLGGGLRHGGVVLKGLWGLWVNIQTSAQTHPAARSHHVVEERGQSVRPLKRLTQPRQRARTKWTLTVVFITFSSKLRWQMSFFAFSCRLRKKSTPGCNNCNIELGIFKCIQSEWNGNNATGRSTQVRRRAWKTTEQWSISVWSEATSRVNTVGRQFSGGATYSNTEYFVYLVRLFRVGLTFMECVLVRKPVKWECDSLFLHSIVQTSIPNSFFITVYAVSIQKNK